MTCIVGWVEEDKRKGTREVWIGGDSAGINCSSLNYRIRKDEKVFRNGEFLFGFTSSFRMGQLLRYSFVPPEQSKNKSDYEYMCTDFVDSIAKVFEVKKYAQIENNEISGGFFLVGYNGNLYHVESDFQVGIPSLNYEAEGCGMDYAMGALHAMRNTKMSPKTRIKKALDAAVEFSAGVRAPYTIKKIGG